MSGRKNVTEYFGTLTRKDSDEVLISIKKFQHYHHFLVQIIRGYPIVWYRDGAGAWERLKNRLQINNLQYLDMGGGGRRYIEVRCLTIYT